MAFDGSIAPGDLLNKLMSAAAGRLFRFGGEWFIWPAYWQGPSFAFGESLLVDSIRGARTGLIVSCSTGCLGLTSRLTTRVPSRNLYIDRGYFNRTTQDNSNFQWQRTKYPAHACDSLLG